MKIVIAGCRQHRLLLWRIADRSGPSRDAAGPRPHPRPDPYARLTVTDFTGLRKTIPADHLILSEDPGCFAGSPT